MLPIGGYEFMPRQSKRRSADSRRAAAWIACSLFLALLSISPFKTYAQMAQTGTQIVRVSVEGQPSITLDRSALAAMPRTRVTASAHHEPPSQWEGVTLQSILQKAGAPSGEQLRGYAMTMLVRITASDHYQVIFTLAELDPLLGHEQVILADTQDGHSIDKDGPYRLVIPGDQRPARWIRNVTTIEVSNAATSSR
jgi:hypothetical protein